MASTKVAALAGRVIESVTIFHGDSENPVSLEIRCVGGTYFCFDLAATVTVSGISLLARQNSKEELVSERRRTFRGRYDLPGTEGLSE